MGVSDRMGRCNPNENWCESTRECVGEGLTCPACTDRLHVFCGQDNFDIKGNRRCCENKEICSQTTNPDNNPYKKTTPRMRNRRSQMRAQLKEQIESDKQELEELDALEIDVSAEQDEEEGVKQLAFFDKYVPKRWQQWRPVPLDRDRHRALRNRMQISTLQRRRIGLVFGIVLQNVKVGHLHQVEH